MTTKDETKQVPGLDEVMVSSEPVQSLDIDAGNGKGFNLTYRTLSWLDKSACVALATEIFVNEDGVPQTRFHVDVYLREALKKMLVEFPWPISDRVLNGLPVAIGNQLQEIIPAPLGEGTVNLAKESEKPLKDRKKTRSPKGAR